MWYIGIGIIVILIVSVIVKKFDAEIRKSQMRKAAINVSMIFGFAMVVAGFVSLLLS